MTNNNQTERVPDEELGPTSYHRPESNLRGSIVKVKTAELSGRALEYATFCAAYTGASPTIEKFPEVTVHGITVPSGVVLSYEGSYKFKDYWRPIKNWEQAGMLIDRFDIDISPQYPGYFASAKMGIRSFGDTRQIAICRAVVASKLGYEVDIPDELMEVGE